MSRSASGTHASGTHLTAGTGLHTSAGSVSATTLTRDEGRSSDGWVQREDGKWYKTDYYKLEEEDLGKALWDRVWVGSWKLAANNDWLVEQRITHVLILGSNSGLVIANRGIRTLSIDDEYSIHKFFMEAATFIKEALAEGSGSVLVTCKPGLFFSYIMVIVYMMAILRMSLDDAISAARSRSSVFQISEVIMAQLRAFEKSLNQRDANWEAAVRERDALKARLAELEGLLREARQRIAKLEAEISGLRESKAGHASAIQRYEQRIQVLRQEYELLLQRLRSENDGKLDAMQREFLLAKEKWELQISQYKSQINVLIEGKDLTLLRQENLSLKARLEELLRQPVEEDVNVELVVEKHEENVLKPSRINPLALSTINTAYEIPAIAPAVSYYTAAPVAAPAVTAYPATTYDYGYSTLNPIYTAGYSSYPTNYQTNYTNYGYSTINPYYVSQPQVYSTPVVTQPVTWTEDAGAEVRTTWSISANCSDPAMAQKINGYLRQNYTHVSSADPKLLLEEAKRAVMGIAN